MTDKSPSSQGEAAEDVIQSSEKEPPVSAASQPTPAESLRPVVAADASKPQSADGENAPAKSSPEAETKSEPEARSAPTADATNAAPKSDAKQDDQLDAQKESAPEKPTSAATPTTVAKPTTFTGVLRETAAKGGTGQQGVLSWLRDRLTMLSDEYAAGNINAAQFNALYRHYSEKRILVEKLIERDPDSKAWQAAAQPGFTQNLRERFQ
ncbi:MAG: hypothetical protein KC615_24635, partial [Anaerolineae bacterium]|nr:hypothetical protein [Anaerolineae bacterium]